MGKFLWLMVLSFLTLNINGLHNPNKWSTLWREIPKKDVICFQKSHLTAEQEFTFGLHAQTHDFFFSNGSTNSCSVLVAVRWSTGVMAVKTASIPGRLIVVDLTFGDSMVL